MWPPPPPREALAATALEAGRATINLRLRSGDERWQAVDIIRDRRLWLWLGLRLGLKLRLRTMLAMAGVFAGLMLVARLVGLAFALVVAVTVVARHERLRLHRNEAGLLSEIRKAFALVIAVIRG